MLDWVYFKINLWVKLFSTCASERHVRNLRNTANVRHFEAFFMNVHHDLVAAQLNATLTGCGFIHPVATGEKEQVTYLNHYLGGLCLTADGKTAFTEVNRSTCWSMRKDLCSAAWFNLAAEKNVGSFIIIGCLFYELGYQ